MKKSTCSVSVLRLSPWGLKQLVLLSPPIVSLLLLFTITCFGQDAVRVELSTGNSPPDLVATNLLPLVGTNGVILKRAVSTNLLEMQALDPFLKLLTNSAGQIVLDYQYYRPNTNSPALIDRPVIDINDHGATAHNGQHTVNFDGNLNRDDGVVIQMPDKQILQGRPAALSISDGAGHRVWLGQLQNCEGSISPDADNQVLYRDAFDTIKADVRFTYDLNFVEQDIILREQPIIPDQIDLETARLEVWTEFFKAQEPRACLQNRFLSQSMTAAKWTKPRKFRSNFS